MTRRLPDGLVHVADREGIVHLADESPFGGLVTGCDLWDEVTVVPPVGEVCGECVAFWCEP